MLKMLKEKSEEWPKTLEKRVEELTAQLAKANKKLEAFSKGLEEKVKERTLELSILYELSKTISYTLDYQKLMNIIMDSLYKIVDYDICAGLMCENNNVRIIVRPTYPQYSRFTEEVQNNLCEAVSLLTGEDIHKKKISTFVIPPSPDAELHQMAAAPISRSKPEEGRDFTKIMSFFNVPFIVAGETLGMLNVSSCKETLLPEERLGILYTIADQASNAIQRLRTIIRTEKFKMEGMVKSMLEGVVMFDEQGEIILLNPQARKMLGFEDTQKVTSEDLYDKLRNAEIGEEKVKFWSGFGASPIIHEVVLPEEEGSKTLHCEIIPVRGPEDKVVGISMALRDITREKEIEKMKNEFISSISHEIKTPLSIIKEAINLVVDEIPGKIVESQRDVLTTAQKNIDRLSNIIGDLLDISKIESEKLELRTKLVNISELIKDTIPDFKYMAEQKGILLDYEVPRVEVDVFCDPDKIGQVLVNLISNALKFTLREGRVKVICNEEEDEVIVSVQDTGIGVSEENIPNLFDRFTQFGRKAGPGEKGTGLGLAISKGIVELHKGRIWAESKLNKGSKFYFSLPKSSSEKIEKNLEK